MKQITVAITGLDGRENPYPGIAIARSLRKIKSLNIRMIALTYGVFTTGIYRTDLFDAIYIIPTPSSEENKIAHRISEIHSEDPIDVLIPALDTEIAVYARLKSVFAAKGIRMLLPSEESVKLRNKDTLYQTCLQYGIPSPKTVVIGQIEQLDGYIPLHYPMVVKGPFADAHVIDDWSELKPYYLKVLQDWGFPVLLQEKIAGEEFDVAAVASEDHKVIAHTAIRKFAISDRGKASAAITIDAPQLSRLTSEIIAALKWSGPCELELMREYSSGNYYLLEINARFPAWIYLTAEAGCNLPEIALALALGESVTEVAPAIPGRLFFRNRHATIVDSCIMFDLMARGSCRSLRNTLSATTEKAARS